MLRQGGPGFNTRWMAEPGSSFPYAACFCEENVWQLAADPRVQEQERFVLFISNAERACAMWAQRSAPAPTEPVVWDYHVVLIGRSGGDARVYDLDSVLPFPSPLRSYLAQSFPLFGRLPARFEPRFRLLGAELYRARFASDRSHMRDGAEWKALPPSWACIRSEEETMNLMRFVDLEQEFLGERCDLQDLLQRFSR